MTKEKISIIIPVLNDADALANLLPRLQYHRQQGHEVLIVDGGSSDASMTVARSQADRILMTGTGRGRQMNLGAENARHEILLFLHADTGFPDDGLSQIQAALADSECHWGHFNVDLDRQGFPYGLIATLMNIRSRLTGVATGDQGIFVRRRVFHDAGCFKAIPLMEDIALSKALRKIAWPRSLPGKLLTSSRRWEREGVIKTILLMWFLRLAYVVGINTDTLARIYYPPTKQPRD